MRKAPLLCAATSVQRHARQKWDNHQPRITSRTTRRKPSLMSQRHYLIGLLCLAWIVPGLIGHDPWKTDEAYNFGVIYDILRGGSWLVPTLAGEPFLDEPPLYYLTAALTATVASPLLPLHDGARLATGLYVGLALLFCGLAGRELHGKGKGSIAPLLVIGCFGLVLRGHEGITDVAPLAGFALAYYAWALALRRAIVGGLLLGLALGMVFLSQGTLETLILVLMGAALPVVCRAWRTRDYVTTMLAAMAVALPLIAAWPLALHSRSPALFELWMQRDVYLLWHNPDRDLLYYLRIMPWHAWPVWALFFWQLWITRREHYATPAVALPLSGFVITLVMLSVCSSTRDLYALTLLPAAALLATPAAAGLRRGAANAWLWFSVTGAVFFIIVAWFYWSGLELGVPARLHAHLHRLQPGYPPGFKLLPFALAACYTIAWLVLAIRLKRSAERPVIMWAAGVTVVWGLIAILFMGWADTGKSYRTTFTGMQKSLPAQYRCVASRHLGETQRAMLHYYANIISRREEVTTEASQCDVLLTQGTTREEPAVPRQWRKIWEGGRPGDKVERYRLYQRNS